MNMYGSSNGATLSQPGSPMRGPMIGSPQRQPGMMSAQMIPQMGQGQMIQGQQSVGNGAGSCINPGNPFTNIDVGMPNDEISHDMCMRMGIPVGARWGPNAGEVRRMQMQSMGQGARW